MEVISLRRSRFFVLLVLAFVLFPARALAWDVIPKGVLYQTVLDDSRTGYVVSAYNQFDAAAYAIGKDPNTIPADVKAKLSDSDYGGRFYYYAQSFFTQSGGLDNVPTWVPTYVIMVSELADFVYADYQAVWYSTATYSLYEDAMVDFIRVFNGEDLSGGGSGGGSDGSILGWASHDLFSYDSNLPSSYPYVDINNAGSTVVSATISDGNIVVGSGQRKINAFVNSRYYVSSLRLYVSPVVAQVVNDYISDGYEVVFTVSANDVGFILGKDMYRSYDLDLSGQYRRYQWHSSVNMSYYYLHVDTGYYDSESPFYVFPNSSSFSYSAISNVTSFGFSSDVFDTPTVSPPDGVWPEPTAPATPDPPEFPEPTSPTVEPEPVVVAPTVTWPDIDITVNPPSVVVPTTPDGQDYTQLLTLINDNLNSINAYTVAINSGLGSIDSDLLVGFDSVVRSIRNVYTYLQHLDDVLERHCVHIRNQIEDSASFLANYVRQLVHWLAEQLDYDSDVTGSNDLFGILSTISNKLGGGTYEPNPISDEQGYYEWLDDLWDRFLLGDDWENSASSMSQDFGQLTTRFPFSVPWDIVALFRLFVHDPVTPVFDLPLYYSAEGSTPVHVDLSPWDGVAAVVRPLLFVIFALKLALLSRNLLAGFGSESGV